MIGKYTVEEASEKFSKLFENTTKWMDELGELGITLPEVNLVAESLRAMLHVQSQMLANPFQFGDAVETAFKIALLMGYRFHESGEEFQKSPIIQEQSPN